MEQETKDLEKQSTRERERDRQTDRPTQRKRERERYGTITERFLEGKQKKEREIDME